MDISPFIAEVEGSMNNQTEQPNQIKPPNQTAEIGVEIREAIQMLDRIRMGEAITSVERNYQNFELTCAALEECEKKLFDLENGKVLSHEDTLDLIKKHYHMLFFIRSIADIQTRPKNPIEAH